MKLPRFKLRTLLIAIALFALASSWLVRQKQLVARRSAMLTPSKSPLLLSRMLVRERPLWEWPVPLVRRLMGDAYYQQINIYTGATDEQMEELRTLFPEAVVQLDHFSRAGN